MTKSYQLVLTHKRAMPGTPRETRSDGLIHEVPLCRLADEIKTAAASVTAPKSYQVLGDL